MYVIVDPVNDDTQGITTYSNLLYDLLRKNNIDAFLRNSQILIRIWTIKNAPTAASDSHLPLFLNHLAAKQATR